MYRKGHDKGIKRVHYQISIEHRVSNERNEELKGYATYRKQLKKWQKKIISYL